MLNSLKRVLPSLAGTRPADTGALMLAPQTTCDEQSAAAERSRSNALLNIGKL